MLALKAPDDPEGCMVSEAIRDFLLAKARAGRSMRYLQALRVSLASFNKGRAAELLTAVTVADIERWLESSDGVRRTKRPRQG